MTPVPTPSMVSVLKLLLNVFLLDKAPEKCHRSVTVFCYVRLFQLAVIGLLGIESPTKSPFSMTNYENLSISISNLIEIGFAGLFVMWPSATLLNRVGPV